MNSKIYLANVSHKRLYPVEHSFVYPVYYYLLDLDELESLQKNCWAFAYNRFRPVAIHDKDYLTADNLSIKNKVQNYLVKYGFKPAERIELLTCARYFNYVFNPVSFFYCYDKNQELENILVEINNTFGERHVYILDQSNKILAVANNDKLSFSLKKDFHVSPFYEMDYDYEFNFSKPGDKLSLAINLIKNGSAVFYTSLIGESKIMNNRNLFSTLLTYPLTASLNMPRILWQASKLHYIKKVPSYYKPKPRSEHTIKHAKPNFKQKFAISVILKIFSEINEGLLILEMPNATTHFFGDKQSSLRVKIDVQHFDFFWMLLKGGDTALGEAYTLGHYKTESLTDFIKLLILNREKLESRIPKISWLQTKFDYLRHLLRLNNINGAKKNISAHYDLSNELFANFLDETMTYSSGLFLNEQDTLEQAQLQKFDRLIEKAEIKSSDNVLEIGCGWGAFAIRAVQKTGCTMKCLTLSEEQASYAREKVKMLGLESKIEICLQDFRQVEGQFDKIISIEMIEAIGYKNYDNFFACLEKCLKSDGLVALQLISFPDQLFEGLKYRCDWIQKYIFPGSLIPSITVLSQAMTKSSKLIIEDLYNMAPSYARTLKIWRERFNDKQAELLSLGFDETFIRTWNYYLSYCEAGFATRTLGSLQLILTRPVNRKLLAND